MASKKKAKPLRKKSKPAPRKKVAKKKIQTVQTNPNFCLEEKIAGQEKLEVEEFVYLSGGEF